MRALFGRWIGAALVLALLAAGPTACTHGDEDEDDASTSDDPYGEIDLQVAAPGLDGKVEVFVDEWGIPHIFATTDHDGFYVQGYMAARDRFGEMELARRIGTGTLAEVVGNVPGVGSLLAGVVVNLVDNNFRNLFTLRDGRQLPDAIVETMNDESVADVQAYADGINAFLSDLVLGINEAEKPTVINGIINVPVEQIREWTIRDTAAVMAVNMWSAINPISRELEYGEALALLGPEKFYDFYRAQPATDAVITPDLGAKSRPMGVSDEVMEHLREKSEEFRRVLPSLQAARDAIRAMNSTLATPGDHSNNWAISGSRTASGHGIYASDPHLSMLNPPFFWLSHVDSKLMGDGNMSFAGYGLPAAPGIQFGHNGRVAWGATNAGYDAYDAYVEQVDPLNPDRVFFEGGTVTMDTYVQHYETSTDGSNAPVEKEIAVVPHHGPILDGSCVNNADGASCISLKWHIDPPGDEVNAILGAHLADNAEEALEAFSGYRRGLYSWAFADVDGGIGYTSAGEIPIRDDWQTYNPWLPLPGTGEAEWIDWVPDAVQSRLLNPAKGYLSTANNDIFGTIQDNDPTDDPYYWYYRADIGYRAKRIENLLEEKDSYTVEDVKRIQTDVDSQWARDLLPSMLAVIDDNEGLLTGNMAPAVERLRHWGFDQPAATPDRFRPQVPTQEAIDESIATTLFHVWFARLAYRTFHDDFDAVGLDLPGDGTESGPQNETRALLNLFSNDPDTMYGEAWFDDVTTAKVETRDDMVVGALADAVAFLESELGPDMSEWTWGRLHLATYAVAFEGISIPGFIAPAIADVPMDGGNFTVAVANTYGLYDEFEVSHGPACRIIVQLDGDDTEAWVATPGGQVERPDSPYYEHLMDEYQSGEYVPLLFKLDDILEATEQRIQFTP
ncbi:MAG: penicillin acylase family protein [Deltaproteobacteria bacterium]|nr:penicillin acylase family protein [Deltaproteobacteria bacterium]MCB9479612.1 penicillin acylase family protein [Deltaproteobacteria bacterium]MCB9488848.1 penicillin acylase family protein [Deltaproteobacteria bacterium]